MSIERAREDLERLTQAAESLRKQREELDAELERVEAERGRIAIFLEMCERYPPDHKTVKQASQFEGEGLQFEYPTGASSAGAVSGGGVPRKRTHITDEMRGKAKELLRQNVPVPQIAAAVGIAQQTMYKHARHLREEIEAEKISANHDAKEAA